MIILHVNANLGYFNYWPHFMKEISKLAVMNKNVNIQIAGLYVSFIV